jgi:PAS domain S-box-containing protein
MPERRSRVDESDGHPANRLRHVLEISTVGVIFFTTDGAITDANDAFLSMSGYSRDDLVQGKVRWDVMTPPEWTPPSLNAVEEFLRLGRSTPYEKEYVRKDGSRWWALFAATRLNEREGAEFVIDITQRKQAEQALLASQERLALALDTAEIYSWDVDVQSGAVWRSSNHPDVLGFALPADSAGSIARVHREDVAAMKAAYERALAGEATFDVEYRIVSPDGRHAVWTRSTGVLVRGAEGAPARLAGVTQNIDERKRAEHERACSAANARFLNRLDLDIAPLSSDAELVAQATRSLGEYLKAGRCYLAEMQADGGLAIRGDWARPGLARLGQAHPLGQWIPPGWRGMFDAGHPIAVQDSRAEPILSDVRDGLRNMDASAFILMPLGNPTGWEASLAVTHAEPRQWHADEVRLVRDVAIRVWPAVKRARAEAALRESEQRFRTVADSSPVMIWVTDANARLEFLNRTGLEFFGLTDEQLPSFDWNSVVHPGDREAFAPAFNAAIVQGEPFHGRTRVRRHDGQWRWIEPRGNPRRDPAGRLTGAIGSAPDITEIYESREALKEADRRKDEFLATLSHELRNPLAPLRHGLEIMRLADGNQHAVEQARSMMERQLGHMVTLVDDLLDLSRISRGQIKIQKERTELAAIIMSARETSEPVIRQSNHTLTVSLPPEPIYVEADKVRLAQALGNLLNNAAKYTEPGGQIAVEAVQEDGEVRISIKDTGVGIPGHMLARVFDMFTQIEDSIERAQGGLGIGLTIVKDLIEMHGGRVEAHSAGPGLGSEFIVHLPAAPALQTKAEDSVVHRGLAHPGPRRILIVDDNEDAAQSMAMLLELMGNETQTAYSGEEALRLGPIYLPDVVLMDIGMPGLTGHEAARLIRAEPWGGQVLLAAVTGWGQDLDRRASQQAGFDRHLVKPVAPEDLEKLLASLQAGASDGAARPVMKAGEKREEKR